MISCQKNKFKIDSQTTYLNGAYMSPLLTEVEKIGHQAISKKCNPHLITGKDFFTHTIRLKKAFAKLISAPDYRNIAVLPSFSYGIATVANNIKLQKGDEIIVIDEQFPSNFYAWKKIAEKNQAIIKIISAPKTKTKRGELWNQEIINSITPKTAVVTLGNIHWADGTLFNLKEIRKKTKENNALLIIDGTQNVGALPFSVQDIKPDALICAGYKWLLGPYSIGLAYYSDYFNNGNPIEENWINRLNSEDFSQLINYQDTYQPKAGRYDVGEVSNFFLTPMLIKSIEQLIEWQPTNIQQYCKEITKKAISELKNLGCFIEDENYRASHLFGVYLPKNINKEKLKSMLAQNKVFVSFRGNAIRISPNVYNTQQDLAKLVSCFKECL